MKARESQHTSRKALLALLLVVALTFAAFLPSPGHAEGGSSGVPPSVSDTLTPEGSGEGTGEGTSTDILDIVVVIVSTLP